MSNASREPCGGGDWVPLIGGVRVSRAWMARHTAQLLAAWCDAPTPERRRTIAVHILQAAGELESEPDDGDQLPVDRAWWATAERIDPRLVRGPDWPPLAAALSRAAATGYDVNSWLPALAGAAPLPERHPARELHWRLLEDCPAALPAAGDGHPRSDPAVHSPPGCPPVPVDHPKGRHAGGASPLYRPTDQGEPQP